jgi:hypothetical protein
MRAKEPFFAPEMRNLPQIPLAAFDINLSIA